MKTKSEGIVDYLNSNIFFKEFTFHQNQFTSVSGTKELADSFIWLDDLCFVLQVKERNLGDVQSENEENKWFDKMIRRAKKQIEDSVRFLTTENSIPIKNARGHTIDVSKIEAIAINKIIVYMPSDLLSEEKRSTKFYESSRSGNIHIFHIEDYYNVCQILITPAEINDYLKFREGLYLNHKKIISLYPEQYILSHFLQAPEDSFINENFITSLPKLDNDNIKWNISEIIANFANKLINQRSDADRTYYHVLKEIAKLNRTELTLFKERFIKMIELSRSKEFSWPFRFTTSRTGCGFVFIPFSQEKQHLVESALVNLTEIYKYKRQLKKCVGVIALKNGDSFDINWTYLESDFTYSEQMENWIKQDNEAYGAGEIAELTRYKFKRNTEE